MSSKDKIYEGNTIKKYRFTALEVAELTDTSVSYVKKIRAGLISIDSAMVSRVRKIDYLLDEGCKNLISAVKRELKEANK